MNSSSPVSSFNEWDPLEEVIVGIVDGAVAPSWNTINAVTVPPGAWPAVETRIGSGTPYPQELIDAARRDLASLVGLLEAEGVSVRRPTSIGFAAPYATPAWCVRSGFCAANPRDLLLVVGDEIIEAPMADRGRYFEAWAYRPLLKEYFLAGARWTAGPKPQLLDDLYDSDHRVPAEGEELRFIITEFEPTFDAADVIRCGRDLFVQKSHATNDLGIAWLRRHLGPEYRVHVLPSRCREAMHIDTTFMPLGPGKVLVNPQHLDIHNLPGVLDDWDISRRI